MKLSIITINYNDAPGLAKTLKSVADQHIPSGFELEHIVIDGASTDNSVEVVNDNCLSVNGRYEVKWVSEKDNGVYNAMNKGVEIALCRRKINNFNRSELVEDKNKGIEIALGLREVDSFNRSKRSEDKNKGITMEVDSFNRSKRSEDKTKGGSSETEHYIQILNSGDILAVPDVLARMSEFLKSQILDGKDIEILYGNMIKEFADGHRTCDRGGARTDYNPSSFLYFYKGTLNHDSAWIKRSLFDRFGLYDEDMRICSDWKWYVDAIALGGVKPIYVNFDVTVFDMNGISESGGKNNAIIEQERRGYLEQILPASVLRDYDMYTFPILQYQRLKKYHLWGLVNLVERLLFKLEKWNLLKK